jgi:hypothetical protein
VILTEVIMLNFIYLFFQHLDLAFDIFRLFLLL